MDLFVKFFGALQKKYYLLFFVFFSFFSVKANFADIDVTHPYFHSINVLQSDGVVEGHEVGETRMFFPLSKINRAEALKLVLLSSQTPAESSRGQIFTDVALGQWFEDYVNTAYQLGIVEGFSDGSFKPANKVVRAEFIKMLFEAQAVPVPEPTEDEAWYEPYLVIATEYRILPGSQEPAEPLGRGEAAEIIYRTKQVAEAEFKRKYTFLGTGLASYYNEGFAGRLTANGEIYDPMALTAAHRTLPFNTRLKVSNDAGDFVVVRITDRGPYHKQRVLDLSQAAFERLGHIGTGVLPVTFELFSEPADEIKAIPEAIRPLLSEQTKAAEIPAVVQTELRLNAMPETSNQAVVLDKSVMYDVPIFGESGSSISTDFFPNIKLRKGFAQKIPEGLVFNLKGTYTGSDRHKEVTVFMQDQKTGEQTHFTAPVSGKNFVVPIYFFKAGKFDLGIVFGEDRESRVANLEVAPYPRERKLPASNVSFASNLNVNLEPENKKAHFRWASGENRLTKMVFFQGEDKYSVVFEDGMSYFAFPYDWFAETFDLNQKLSIDLFQAVSADGSLFKQRTNWKKTTFKNFVLRRGFPDTEEEGMSIKPFKRFYRAPQTISLQGVKHNSNFNLESSVFITTPKGQVETTNLWQNGDDFNFSFRASEKGRYIVELISTAGDILFNRAIYVDDAQILPVMANEQTVVKQNSKMATYDWINKLRTKHQINTLLSNVDLQAVAQAYAERMAAENFIGHVDPEGNGPAERLKALGRLSFAENVSYGTTLNLALSGLENSGSHRKNILSTRWSRMGVGIAQNNVGEFYVVQLFAS